ncbi:hypothetical protein [Streptomyces xanthii]|uniref:Uncharacterized protein n=1 Tax=Streptomyces xanthii TaxID=2768069 RepID=A0A7H1BLA0_9ACTN|nr:hypothetical protein [Streptomyces xanthii]QNS09505.1 hypothetical protein IAG42_37790 [Streptomyces xanthii]
MAPPPPGPSKPARTSGGNSINAVTAHFLGTIRYDAATHDYEGQPLPTEQHIHSRVIAEDIADELRHSLGYEKPDGADYVQQVHDVAVRPAERLRQALIRAVQINNAHHARGHGMECTCDLDALELVEQLAAYATEA